MEFKNVAKNNRVRRTLKSKTLPIPNVELITENVFVPITKTIFTKRREAIGWNFFKRKIKLVESRRCKNSVTTLLKKPFSLPMKSYENPTSYSKQTNKAIERKKMETFKTESHIIDRNNIFTKDRSQKKKKQILTFPSSISELPLTWLVQYQSFSMDEDAIKWNKRKENDRTSEKVTIEQNPNFSKTNRNDKSFESSKAESVARRSIISNDTLNIPIVSSSTAIRSTTATVKKDSIEEERFWIPYDGNYALKKDDAIVQHGAIPNSVTNHGEELKFCSTLDNWVETNGTTTRRIVATQNFQHSRDDIDRSILSFLKKNRSRYQDDTGSHKNEHHYPCTIKYSWQVIGTSSQTSRTLLETLIKENNVPDDESIRNCSVKYSWQIIGIATQTSQRDFITPRRHSVVSFLSAKANASRNMKETANDAPPVTGIVWRKGKRYIVLHNQCTQTFAHKENQTILTELYKKCHD